PLFVQPPALGKLASVESLGRQHGKIVFVRQVTAKEVETKQRNQSQRKQQRTNQRRGHRPGHRRKNPAFVALQREDGNVRRNDDEHREKRGTPRFGGRVQNEVGSRVAVGFVMVRVA